MALKRSKNIRGPFVTAFYLLDGRDDGCRRRLFAPEGAGGGLGGPRLDKAHVNLSRSGAKSR